MSDFYGPPGQFGPPPQGPPPQGPPGPPPGGPAPYGHQPPYGAPYPPGPPQPPRRSNAAAILVIGIGGTLVLALVAVLALGAMAGWFESKADDITYPAVSPTATSTSAYSGSSGDSDGDGSAADPTTAAPDPTTQAFNAVSAGDCLTVYDTGYGGDLQHYDWSTDVPPDPVSCSSSKALVKVTEVTDDLSDCATGTGRGRWYHLASDGGTTVLCMSRIYRTGYCLLAVQKGSGSGATITLGDMTGVDCTVKKVPKPYNQIMHITGVPKHSGTITAATCSRAANDTTYYYWWKVDGGTKALCTIVYRG